MNDESVKPVGTVVGVSSTTEFQMQVRPDAVRTQDLVAVDTIEDGVTYRVWAKVGQIERLNPLFPREAAQELAFQGRDPIDSVVSMSKEMITATCTVVGVLRDGRLEPPKYPVQPAIRVYVPPADEVEALLVGETPVHRRLFLGTERGNQDVNVYVDGHMVLSRHLAILASTGAGKTVAARRIIDELRDKGYPVLIFDPHGDYERLVPKDSSEVVSYVPDIQLASESIDQVISYIAGLSGEEITPPQASLIAALMTVLSDPALVMQMNSALDEQGLMPLTETLERNHFHALSAAAAVIQELKAADDRAPLPRAISSLAAGLNVGTATANAVRRQTGAASKQYSGMRKMNRTRLGEAIPLPIGENIRTIIKQRQVARVVLEGYSEALRQSLVASIMQELLAARVDGAVPRFVTVIEEAHNFIPGWTAGGSDVQAPSLPVIKQVATEGRKYGMGLIFISQRPSRIDATVLSQANSYLVLRIVNPNDQRYIRDVVETMGESEAAALPNLNTGEALLSGMFTRIPVMVRIERSLSEGKHEEEDFLGYVRAGDSGAMMAAEE